MGGFAGNSTSTPNDYNAASYLTTLSGDLLGNDAEPNDIGSLFFDSARSDNSFNVVRAVSMNGSASLRGLTITGGHASGSKRPHTSGAGIYIEQASVDVSDCTLTANSAYDGAAVHIYVGGNATLVKCRIVANSAGGLRNDGGAAIVSDCLFIHNNGTSALAMTEANSR